MTSALKRLGDLGAAYRDPMQAIDWHAAKPGLPWLPARMTGLGGAEVGMDAKTVLRLSRLEFARICAAGLWVEGLLISKIGRLGYPGTGHDAARVMLTEVREEAGHGLMFLEMIRRAGLENVALLGRTGLLSAVARLLPADSAEFWALVYVGESVTDTFALKALQLSLQDGEEICPLARQVLSFHHRDEARHIAAARSLLEARVGAMSAPRKLAFAVGLKRLLPKFITATLYPTAVSISALGLEEPERLARLAAACPNRAEVAANCSAPALKFLSGLGLGGLESIGPSLYPERHPDELA